MTNITAILAKFAAELSYEKLPGSVVVRTKLLILDVAGIIVRARHDAESTASLIAAVKRLGLNTGKCSVMGDSAGYTPTAAALVNGSLAHSLDFDDTHAAASLHSSAPIVPAALAAAEMTGASGRDVIAACVAGYEVQIRLALALGPADHYDRGYHPTATCGVFGAVVAAGKLLGMSAVEIQSAFGIALSQSAGSMQFLVDGSWTKRSHVGQAAQNGLICAVMAAEGFKGPKAAFEGKWGFLHSHAPNSNPNAAVAGLGERWETLNLAVKPYPSCRYSHAPMDGLIQLRETHDIEIEDIKEVDVGLAETGWKIIGDPADGKHKPKTVVDGQFSMPFCAAVVLREGKMSWDDYAKHLSDGETLALCERVRVFIDPRVEELFPSYMSGTVRISTSYGQYETLIKVPLGEPENFMAQEAFQDKFDGLCAPYLGEEQSSKFADALLHLEEANSLASIMALSQPVLN
ncbi:MAG: MmgE/PrpD family protein [Rhodospirillaceae bacterium TMED8]|nr:MmgE/PrpD family protein [Magnetovibrio sp.]OUT52271.1 MAG: MmgE/PrpD family protein [Rhodospirillaceae bacterium TMED8]